MLERGKSQLRYMSTRMKSQLVSVQLAYNYLHILYIVSSSSKSEFIYTDCVQLIEKILAAEKLQESCL